MSSLDVVAVTETDGDLVGQAPEWFGGSLFGGFLLGQAVHAATRDAPPARRLHSLHGYFLRPARAGIPLRYAVTTVREGRSFATRQVEACQEGKPVFLMTCSFTADGEGYEYGAPGPADVPGPEGLPRRSPGPGPMWEMVDLGPTPAGPDGFRDSTSRAWLRVVAPLPDDPGMHAAMLAYATDVTRTGGRPLHLDGDVRGLVSLDHAVWVHRPPRADEWLLYDVQSLVNTGGRGLLRGSVYDGDRRLVATVAQEMLIRPYESVTEG